MKKFAKSAAQGALIGCTIIGVAVLVVNAAALLGSPFVITLAKK